jgi:uncharacterized protein YodC (DUF2158 family)
MPEALKVGDVVRLKSGGPVMTVSATAMNGRQLICAWFVGEENKSAAFSSEALVAAELPSK